MKYYHLIYNSSERSAKGAPGFGIHTYSEDLQKEVLAAIEKDPELFAFQYKGAQLSPNTLNNAPETIKDIIPTWIYAVIPIGEGKRAYVLGRKIAVGFDYSFYKTGQPTRLGNYVGDYYITLETPSADFWNLMYTRTDGVQFLPASPVPTLDNEDMKAISLGEPKLLPPMEDIVATAPKAKGVHPFALEIIFGILESRKSQKPLLVKMTSKDTAEVLADVFRLLPPDVATECPFTTNYHQMGRRQGYNIFVINEAYQGQVMEEQWVSLDLMNGKTVISKERDTFLPIVQKYADRGVWDYARSTIIWILSDAYAKLKNSDPKFNTLVLSYLNNDDFDFEKLSQNSELINALAPILQKDEVKRDYLFDYLWYTIRNTTSPKQIKKVSQELTLLKPLGADFIANEWKPDATKMVLESGEAFLAFYNSIQGNLNSVSNVMDFAEFANHKEILSSFAKSPDVWRKLRPLFIPNAANDFEEFVMFAIKEGFDFDNLVKAVEEVNPNKMQLLDSLVAIFAKTEPKDEAQPSSDIAAIHKKVITHIADCIKDIDYYPFIDKLPNRYDDNICRQLYLWDIQKNIERKLTAISLNSCTETLALLRAVYENVPSLKEEAQQLSTSASFSIKKTSEIVSNLHSAYTTLVSKDDSMVIDAAIIHEIETLVNLFGISLDLIRKHAENSPLAKALNSVLNIHSILKIDVSNVSENQIRKAMEMKRPSFVKATLPIVLKQQLSPAAAEFVSTEYVKCNAIKPDELLREVQKPEFEHNRHAVWAILLHNFGLKPEHLVKKIAGLYEEPDEKGKFSDAATAKAIDFMKHFMPADFQAWNKKQNSLWKIFLRAVGSLYEKILKKSKGMPEDDKKGK